MARRYNTDALARSKKKEYMVRRYSTDTLFQKMMKEYMVRRYARIKNKNKPYIRYNQETHQPLVSKAMESAIQAFRCKIQQGLTHVCTVCHRALFPDQVKVESTVNSLPRPSSESQLLQVKLKRHVKFKGYQHFHTVNMHNVLAALSKLKAVYSEYRDISIRETAIFESHLDEEADVTEKQQEVDVAKQDKQQVSVEEKDELGPGLTLDTCMQPPDIGQEILSYGEGIFSIAPAQGQKPVGFFKIPKLEAMAFPVQFPTGTEYN
ncbi:hypothetical protein DPX16_3531 [Anabarilius grahami]|uniref:Uncharacterized protein n=1 Tax=Anabarilius grahami TaxID=495550 RepID=A0A3N0YX81_ANAGA|nr:hypothetical protein DPX16_3531 [Anabarilius grahami]